MEIPNWNFILLTHLPDRRLDGLYNMALQFKYMDNSRLLCAAGGPVQARVARRGLNVLVYWVIHITGDFVCFVSSSNGHLHGISTEAFVLK